MSSDSESDDPRDRPQQKKNNIVESDSKTPFDGLNLDKIDMFGQPIKLLINGKNTYTTCFGGCATVCFLISACYAFVILFYVKIVGYQPSSLIVNTQGMLDDTGYQEPTDGSFMNLTVGFVSPNILGIPDDTPSFDSEIGRFELLQVKKQDGSISYSRQSLEECDVSDNYGVSDTLLCIPRTDFKMEIYGDMHSDDFSTWFIQYRPCITYSQAIEIYTQEELKDWENSDKGISGEALYQSSCSSQATDFYDNYQITLYAGDVKIDSEASAYYNTSIYISNNRKILQNYVDQDGLSVSKVNVQENVHIIYDKLTTLYGAQNVETYLTVNTQTTYLRETQLFKGISNSLIINKSKYFDTVVQQSYDNYQFLSEFGGYLIFSYLICYIIVRVFTREFMYENIMKKLFLTNTINMDHVVSKYFGPQNKKINKQIEQLHSTRNDTREIASDQNLLDQDNQSNQDQQKDIDGLAKQNLNRSNKSKAQAQKENGNLLNPDQNNNNDKQVPPSVQTNQRPPQKKLFAGIMQILAQGVLFRQPYNHNKWTDIVKYSACPCIQNKDRKEKFFRRGKDKINKDLEITTYIKQFAKLRALKNALLDRKQTLLLKYQMQMVMELKKSGQSKLKDEIKNRFKTMSYSDQKKEIFITILGLFQDQEPDVSDLDVALLKGLFSFKQFDEQEMVNAGLKQDPQEVLEQQKTRTQMMNQYNSPDHRRNDFNRPTMDSPRGTINNDRIRAYPTDQFNMRRVIKNRKSAAAASIYSEPKKVVRSNLNPDPEASPNAENEFRQTTKQKVKGGFEAQKQIKIYPDSEEGDRNMQNRQNRARELTQIEQSAFEEAKSESEHDSIEREINRFYEEEDGKQNK